MPSLLWTATELGSLLSDALSVEHDKSILRRSQQQRRVIFWLILVGWYLKNPFRNLSIVELRNHGEMRNTYQSERYGNVIFLSFLRSQVLWRLEERIKNDDDFILNDIQRTTQSHTTHLLENKNFWRHFWTEEVEDMHHKCFRLQE